MIDKPPFIDNLAREASKLFSGEKTQLHQDLEGQMKALLVSSFAKMELITRDEFDDQLAVLQETRRRLELLEQHVKALEAGEPLPDLTHRDQFEL